MDRRASDNPLLMAEASPLTLRVRKDKEVKSDRATDDMLQSWDRRAGMEETWSWVMLKMLERSSIVGANKARWSSLADSKKETSC
jgi:hypothetical protein